MQRLSFKGQQCRTAPCLWAAYGSLERITALLFVIIIIIRKIVTVVVERAE